MIEAPPKKYGPPEVEREVLAWWASERIFERSVEQRKGAAPFVFLEGPPTANGLPHPGHVLTRTLKDAVNRYKVMRGHHAPRRAGWDCHGLPVEIEIEKKLGLADKTDIEAYGVARFNEACRESVFRYRDKWEEMSRRVGYWLDFERPYVTMSNEYIESVWWSLKEIHAKGLLYKGHRVSPYCPRCGTALSSHEVAQGYQEVTEPSVYVRFRVTGKPGAAKPRANEHILAWTTTPWTLPGNVALAVGPGLEYVCVEQNGDLLWLAEPLARATLKGEWNEVDRARGADLVGWSYEPLMPWLADSLDPSERGPAWTVVEADFVTTEDGTGVVHTAVMYGEEDYELGTAIGLPKRHTVDERGRFLPLVEPWKGQWVKDAEPAITEWLKAQGRLYRVARTTHTYPFCWRCDTPLLYYARDSWFIAMRKLRDRLVALNAQVNWFPEHVKEGRFGDFIREVRDWALSRDRYWGTPLPVWTCEGAECGAVTVVGSAKELRERATKDPGEALDLHKPAIDEVLLRCAECNGTMRREGSVIDAWYDSGAAPFAQWHYPFENQQLFQQNFPVDFVSEGLDQTRGWFYSMLAISTAVFGKPAYRNVVVNGLVLAEDGQKMSKSKRNYTDPDILFQREGADAVRWALLTGNAPWAAKRFYEGAVREQLSKYLLTLFNTYGFFATYAAVDGWQPGTHAPPREKRPLLDRWLLDRLDAVVEECVREGDRYNVHKVARAIEDLVVDDLSNWYVRLSRKRLWSETPLEARLATGDGAKRNEAASPAEEADSEDKAACYATLHEALTTTARLTAPYTPFIAEFLWRKLRGASDPDSVHLADYPEARGGRDEQLLEAMRKLRAVTEAGRALRAKVNVKTRHPLPRVILVVPEKERHGLERLTGILGDELNVKEVGFAQDAAAFERYTLAPNRAALGPRFKGNAPQVAAAIEALDAAEAGPRLAAGESVTLDVGGEPVELGPDAVEIGRETAQGWAATEAGGIRILLDVRRDEALIAEGYARELLRRIQEMRKELDLHVGDGIETVIALSGEVPAGLEAWKGFLADESRSRSLDLAARRAEGQLTREWDIEGLKAVISISKADR